MANQLGVNAITPTSKIPNPPKTIAKSKAAPIDTNYQLRQGESTPDYNARVSAYNASKKQPTYPGLMGESIKKKETPTYSGLVGDIAAASRPSAQQQDLTGRLVNASGPTATQTGLVKDLRRAGDANTAIGQKGQDIANLYAPEIGRIGGLGAGAQAGFGSTGSNVVGEGNSAIAAQNASARMNALATAEQAQLYGIDKQLTAQNQLQNAYDAALGGANTQQMQQITGLGNAATSANTQQAQQITGLGSAAGYAQPQLGAIGQVPFNPLDQGQGNILGSTQQGGLTGAGQLLGQFEGSKALGAAPYSGQATGIQAVAAAPGSAQADIIGTQTQQIASYQSALQQGQNLQSQLSDLITTFGLNPFDLNAANAGIQKIAQNTSSPQYQILKNYINDIANTYAQILTPPGGSATDTTRGIAASMLNETASGQTLQAVMQSLDEAARAKIAGVSTTGAPSPSVGSGNTVKAGGYSFVQDASGKWVPAR